MNLIEAIKGNERRKLIARLRKNQKRVNQLFRDLPYCSECGHRVLRRHPCEHLQHD